MADSTAATAATTGTGHQQDQQKAPSYNTHWRIFRKADDVRSNTTLLTDAHLTSTVSKSDNDRLLRLAGDVMHVWGEKWATVEQGTRWASFLNKKDLEHEVEESIVALAPLLLWLENTSDKNNGEKITVVDVCCGKGICSILLSYLCGQSKVTGYRSSAFDRVGKIVMLDKATSDKVDWGHITEANKDAAAESRPMIELWEGCNLHETDAVYDKFEAIPTPLAFVGIHLCRHLSPACVGLVNALGPQCRFLSLAPCCLPRQARRTKRKNEEASIIPIPLYEEPAQRKARIEAMKLREHALGRGKRGANCYLCGSPEHFVRACPELNAKDVEERIAILKDAAREAPCWRCGKLGHSKKNCPAPDDAPCRPRFVAPPTAKLDCYPAAISDDKFDVYCRLLAEHVQSYDSIKLVKAPLAKKGNHEDQVMTWNSGRKSTFIVVER